MKTLLVIVVVVVQLLNLAVFWWFSRVAWFRILALTAARRVQAQGEEAEAAQ